jgi:thiol-disulfide isomerase/thioredoxin
MMNNTVVYGVIAAALVIVTFGFSYFIFRVPEKASDGNFNKEFSLVLKDFDGKEVPMYSFRRQIMVAYAWASWCTYCGEELKRLATLKKTYGDKIQIVAVNRAEPKIAAQDYINKLGLGDDVELLLDPDDSFFKSIGGYAMPETVFIDVGGNVVYHQRGPLDEPALQARMKELVH